MTTVEQRDRAHERRRRPDFVWTELLPKNAGGTAVTGETPGTVRASVPPGAHPNLNAYATQVLAAAVRAGLISAPRVDDDLLPRSRRAPQPEPEFIDLFPAHPGWAGPLDSALKAIEAEPAFPDRVICRLLEFSPAPMTAYELAREVLKRCPNLRARSTLERRVRKLASKGTLRELDCAGVSPDGAPCWRYELVRAAA